MQNTITSKKFSNHVLRTKKMKEAWEFVKKILIQVVSPSGDFERPKGQSSWGYSLKIRYVHNFLTKNITLLKFSQSNHFTD